MNVSHEDLAVAVYGELYRSASTQMQLIDQSIQQQRGKGFSSFDAAAKWAHENLLDIITISKMYHNFFNVSHLGELLTASAWQKYYGEDILFVWVKNEDESKKDKAVLWKPKGFEYYNRARVSNEVGDGVRKPLYHRDYFTPTGYYDPVRNTFNVAKPFPVFARETGRDTSHIYKLIEHIGGDCALWLLAWLRTKMCYPLQKTQIIPVIVSRAQGTGKSTFGEVLCKGLFGKDNVIVTDQYDSQARFNADYADALVVCQEEKDETDRRNPAASIKSRSTATQIRKEYKGIDPIYQDSYTEFIMTSNRDVPIKFDDREDQRRFMIMGADEDFTRKTSKLADEVFTKLYGQDENNNTIGIPFVQDTDLIAQFKHELYTNKDIAEVPLRQFPKTAAYHKCFTLPRTTENTEIEAIMRSLAPFIQLSLQHKKLVTQVTLKETDEVLSLGNYLQSQNAMVYMPDVPARNKTAFVALCRPAVFYDAQTGKPFNHSTVERCIYDCEPWLLVEYGIHIVPDMEPLPGGFPNMHSRYRSAAAARFMLAEDSVKPSVALPIIKGTIPIVNTRVGKRLRVNGKWRPDPEGEFETVNEMKPGIETLDNKNQNVQYMDTFLFESDEVDKRIYSIEQSRIELRKQIGTTDTELTANILFAERLRLQLSEALNLFRLGVAARIVYSGGKSYHILVRVKDSPQTLDEYKWLHAHLCNAISDKLIFDPTTADPARLTRAPITVPRTMQYCGVLVQGTQQLVHENWNNVYEYTWRPQYETWLNRPLAPYEQFGKRLVPTRQEYKDAMFALLNGTFWTDDIWNGRRQQCFFPGYRLCRYLGYSHEVLWADGGILDGLDKYYRKHEIQYWSSRETSSIVRQIDNDIIRMEEENECS